MTPLSSAVRRILWAMACLAGVPLAIAGEEKNLLEDPSFEVPKKAASGPAAKPIASFEEKNPFDGGTVVTEHATDGRKALRIDKSYVSMGGPQDWSGYDLLKADLYTDAKDPLPLYVEVRDAATRDYWTRVNYQTVVPPGQSTLAIPVKQLYVGEKSRPGRMLLLGQVARLVFNIGNRAQAPLFLDNVRLERDTSARDVAFDGLYAFDLGTSSSPLMDGFTRISPGTLYTKGRGFGLKDARIWRAFDVLQPDPLYQDFLCIESGGLAVDVPNGRYHVFVNLDNPSGFWGEYQSYTKRTVLAEGKPVAADEMDFDSFREKYFRFWNVEDLPSDNTFDKYQKAYYWEKEFDVDVSDGQLNLEFQGANWACSVSAVVIYPVEKAAQGEKFLQYVEAKRRFYFDNYFKRVLHRPTGDELAPSQDDYRRGFVLFQRDWMQDVYYNDTPRAAEIRDRIEARAFAGEYEPVTLGVVPLAGLGRARLHVTNLTGLNGQGDIPNEAIEIGYVSYRITRVTAEGTVYTIRPRLIMPGGEVELKEGVTRRFWLTIKTPPDARPGQYYGELTLHVEKGRTAHVPLVLDVCRGTLDPVDIPVGPWGYTVGIPWRREDRDARYYNEDATLASLRKMREYGFTAFSGMPQITYRGFKAGQPVLDFSRADGPMQTAKELGFLAVVSYGSGIAGFNAYFQDKAAMSAAGFQDYSQFVKAIYTAVEKHAVEHHWLPVYYNLGDEPIGDDVIRSAENAEAYRKAFPQGPPWFTGASSFLGNKRDDPHFRLAKALHIVDWNLHDEAAVDLLHEAGGQWAFYNGGNRWTFGDYMYKAVQRGMKFRLSWHWNCAAGDPYYALDCREDDYAWVNGSPSDYTWPTGSPGGRLIPSIHFEQLREGLDDYRRLVTLARLAREKRGTAAAQAAEKLIRDRMAAFRLNQRDHDALFGADDWRSFRRRVDDAIESLR